MRTHGTLLTIEEEEIDFVSLTFSGGDRAEIQTTTQSTANNTHTYESGLKDGGSIEISGIYKPADAGQAALVADDGTRKEFVITLTDTTTIAFYGLVKPMSFSVDLDDNVTYTCSVKITGHVIITP